MQVAEIVAEQHQLLQPPRFSENFLRNVTQQILAQVHLGHFHETSESVLVDHLNLVPCQIQHRETFEAFEVLFVYVWNQIFLQEQTLEVVQVVEGIGRNSLWKSWKAIKTEQCAYNYVPMTFSESRNDLRLFRDFKSLLLMKLISFFDTSSSSNSLCSWRFGNSLNLLRERLMTKSSHLE